MTDNGANMDRPIDPELQRGLDFFNYAEGLLNDPAAEISYVPGGMPLWHDVFGFVIKQPASQTPMMTARVTIAYPEKGDLFAKIDTEEPLFVPHDADFDFELAFNIEDGALREQYGLEQGQKVSYAVYSIVNDQKSSWVAYAVAGGGEHDATGKLSAARVSRLCTNLVERVNPEGGEPDSDN